MNKFRFRQFQAYKDALEFQRKVKHLSRTNFPKEEQFCLTSQLRRASYSIVLNIAEGSDRSTDKDFAHFLNNAHASLNEVVACFDLSLNSNYISDSVHKEYLEEAEKLANQITAFRKRLLEKPNK